MLTQLGRFITRKPWLIIAPVIVVTIILASALPTLEFRTNFSDFAPDTPQTNANTRITAYFGSTQRLLLLHTSTIDNSSLLTPQILRQQYYLEHTISTRPYVNTTVSIAALIDAACQLDFNKTLGNCTDEEIATALSDILIPSPTNLTLLTDPNEPTDTNPRLGKPRSNDILDIKTASLSSTNTTLTLILQVYNLSTLPTTLQPPVPRTSLLEWFIAFTNHFTAAGLDFNYQLSVRLQPKNPLWTFGNSLADNLNLLRTTRGMHREYIAAGYLWVTPPNMTIIFPLKLQTANISFDRAAGKITLTVSRNELRQYGIAPAYDGYKLPAKLTNFTAGSRTYAPLVFFRIGGHIYFNTTTLFGPLKTLQQRRFLGSLVTRLLEHLGLPADALQNLTNVSSGFSLPPTFSLADIQSRWQPTDRAPDTGSVSLVYPLLPRLFSIFRNNILTFFPRNTTNATRATESIAILFLNATNSSSEIDRRFNEITGLVQNNSRLYPQLRTSVTGSDIVSTEVNKVAMDANMVIAPLIFIIIVIILFLAFRRPSYVFLPVVVFMLSTIWLFGTMAWLRIPFNILAVAILPLNIGLGVEYLC